MHINSNLPCGNNMVNGFGDFAGFRSGYKLHGSDLGLELNGVGRTAGVCSIGPTCTGKNRNTLIKMSLKIEGLLLPNIGLMVWQPGTVDNMK